MHKPGPTSANILAARAVIPRRHPALSFVLETFQTILLAIILYFLIDLVVARVRVENISMLPTLEPGEFLLVNRLAYRFGGDVHQGDIVIFPSPYNPQEDYIKRAIGLEGDLVRVLDHKVYVNGNLLDERYIKDAPVYNGEWKVPQGAVFVLGDNRNDSEDSHIWGFIQRESIIGKAVAIYWPLDKIRTLKTPNMIPIVE